MLFQFRNSIYFCVNQSFIRLVKHGLQRFAQMIVPHLFFQNFKRLSPYFYEIYS